MTQVYDIIVSSITLGALLSGAAFYRLGRHAGFQKGYRLGKNAGRQLWGW